jgi:hypothetical protein
MRYLAVIALSLTAFHSPLARGDSPAKPYSNATQSSDGQFIFVMLSPLPPEQDGAVLRDEFASQIRRIRQAYPKSGMYRNDGSREPLWTVDWYAYRVEVPSDGVHLIRHGPWPPKGAFDTEAISFFAKGQLLKTYEVRDLVAAPEQLPQSVSHFQWLKSSRLDDAALTFDIDTMNGERYTFDVLNGDIIAHSRSWLLWALVGLYGLVAAGGAILLWFVVRRLTRARRSRSGVEGPVT